jgi:hypothetical protein
MIVSFVLSIFHLTLHIGNLSNTSFRNSRTFTNLRSTRTQNIKIAIESRTLYRDRRLAWLDRSQPDGTRLDIGPTVLSTKASPRKGLVAMLDLAMLDKTRVVDVFCDMLAASISAAIEKGTQSGGHRFEMWSSLSPELRDTFTGDIPLPRPKEKCTDRRTNPSGVRHRPQRVRQRQCHHQGLSSEPEKHTRRHRVRQACRSRVILGR